MPIMQRAKHFISSEAGSILPFFAITLVVFMGILALTYDIGRMGATQAELQSFADNVALAAAGELDGSVSSITRATAAAATMIQDTASFGIEDDVLSGPGDYSISFMTSSTTDVTTPGLVTTDPKKAHFVRIAVHPQTVEQGFGAAFSALSNEDALSGAVAAQAEAGFSLVACDITPLMFCIPTPDFRADEHIGATVLMRSGGQGSAWGPGDFGFLDPSSTTVDQDGVCAGLNGANLDGCLIAAVGNRLGCFAQEGVSIKPGQNVGTAEAALNVLFDVYDATMNNVRNNASYPPAPNVISCYVPKSGKCLSNNANVSTNTVGLPVDDCFAAGTCTRFGNGVWSAGRQNYVSKNYGASDPHPTATTRYAYYKAEIAAAGGGASKAPILKARAEKGRPQCSIHQSPDPARRVMVAAAIDCGAAGIQGSTANVPVREFVEIFMLRPIGLDGTRDVWIEILGSAGGSAGGNQSNAIVRDVVRLVK